MRQNRLKKTFLHNVSKNIRCSKKDKKNYLDYISVSLDDFLYENPDADYKQVCENLGEPFKLACEYSEKLNSQQLKKYRAKRAVVISLVCALFASLLIAFYWYLIYEINYIEYIVESPAYVYVEDLEDITALSKGENV